jgi:hypothetical protein
VTKAKEIKLKRPMGRPRIDAIPVNVRFPPVELAALDFWMRRQRESKPASRAKAVRYIVAMATGVEPMK